MKKYPLILLNGSQVDSLLKNREREIFDLVRNAYQTHARGDTVIPPNVHLELSHLEQESIVAKAAFVGGEFQTAGLEWSGSFPQNVNLGLEQAPSTLILNCAETGKPLAILESSILREKCTAASAALAVQSMYPHRLLSSVGLVGGTMINFETLRFLLILYPELQNIYLLEPDKVAQQQFQLRLKAVQRNLSVFLEASFSALLEKAAVIAVSSVGTEPHISIYAPLKWHTLILDLAHRALVPEMILSADNVVEVVEVAFSDRSSWHLAALSLGHRGFIRTTLGDILNGVVPPYDPAKKLHIFNASGLGILDIALAKLVMQKAIERKVGLVIEEFSPKSWTDRD